MDQLTGWAAGLLNRSVRALPDQRREWGEAVLAEAEEVPAGRSRVSWLLGGVWLVARETGLLRSICYGIAAVVASVAVVWFAWNPESTNPATPISRIDLIATVAMLTMLPWIGRYHGWLGPVGRSRPARVVRAGGYLLIWALLLVRIGVGRFAGARFEHFQAFNQDNWESEMVTGAITGSLVIFGLTTAYTVGVLAMTSRRSTVAPTTLAFGAASGLIAGIVIYALTPLGGVPNTSSRWLNAGCVLLLLLVAVGTPVVAGRLAMPQRLAAGLWSGMVAGLVITNLTITTMLIMPRAVPLIWANPDPNAPHGTLFEIQMTVSDTAGQYLVVLFLAPLLGLLGGGVRAVR